METVKYILKCLAENLDAIVGSPSNGSIEDFFVGFVSMLILLAFFLISLYFLTRKTTFSYKLSMLFSILATILFTLVAFTVIILVETLCR